MMKLAGGPLLLTLALCFGCASSPSTPVTTIESELREITDETIAALLSGDRSHFERLLHPDYVATAADGRVIDYETFMETFSPPPASMKPKFEVTGVRVFPHGDTAVMTARRSFTGVVNGREIRNLEQTTQVFRRSGGEWRLIAEHSSKPGA